MIGRTNVGSGFVNVKARNYTVLPASGRQNDVVVIGANTVTDTVVSNDEPTVPTEGMVWMKIGRKSNAYLSIGEMSLYITSIVQYVSGSWSVINEWYIHNGTEWIRGRVYIIKDGAITGYTTISASNGGTLYTSENPLRYRKSTGSNIEGGGVVTGVDCFAQFSTVSFRATWSNSSGSGYENYMSLHTRDATMDSGYAITPKSSANRTDSSLITTLPITYNDSRCVIQFYSSILRNGNVVEYRFYDLYLD